MALYSTFLQRAYDQILHDVCIGSLPVVFAVDRADWSEVMVRRIRESLILPFVTDAKSGQ